MHLLWLTLYKDTSVKEESCAKRLRANTGKLTAVTIFLASPCMVSGPHDTHLAVPNDFHLSAVLVELSGFCGRPLFLYQLSCSNG